MQMPPEGTFEYHFADRSMNAWRRVLEKHCSVEAGEFAAAMVRCSQEHKDTLALSQCIAGPGTVLSQCSNRAQDSWFGAMENSKRIDRVRHCLALGDTAPKKCWKHVDRLFEEITPESTYPSETPNVDRFMREVENSVTQSLNELAK